MRSLLRNTRCARPLGGLGVLLLASSTLLGCVDEPVTTPGGPRIQYDAGVRGRADSGPGSPSGRDAGAPTPGRDSGSPPQRDAGPPAPIDPPPTGCGTAIEQQELAETNASRNEMGLRPLACDEALTRAARLHSEDMCALGYFAHDSQDGRDFIDRIRAQGARFRTAGENIAFGQTTPAAVHRGWMNSPGHRANILNPSYGRIGIGYAACGGRPFWTQDFTD